MQCRSGVFGQRIELFAGDFPNFVPRLPPHSERFHSGQFRKSPLQT